MTSYADRYWAYHIKGNDLYLFELDDYGEYTAPTTDITDGLKIEYLSGDAVFNDSSGFSDDTSPSEASYINLPDSYLDALVAYIKARLAGLKGEIQLMEYWDAKYNESLQKSVEALTVGPRVVITRFPYAIR